MYIYLVNVNNMYLHVISIFTCSWFSIFYGISWRNNEQEMKSNVLGNGKKTLLPGLHGTPRDQLASLPPRHCKKCIKNTTPK